jgi:hypothetical protein
MFFLLGGIITLCSAVIAWFALMFVVSLFQTCRKTKDDQ